MGHFYGIYGVGAVIIIVASQYFNKNNFSLFLGGFIIGKKSSKKGWLEGLKLSLIFTIILILFNLLGLGNKIEFKNIVYYIIIIASCMFGGMLGINKTDTK